MNLGFLFTYLFIFSINYTKVGDFRNTNFMNSVFVVICTNTF